MITSIVENYQKSNKLPIKNMFFRKKKEIKNESEDTSSKDLAIVTQMNQEFAKSLDLKETLQNSLEVIIKRINAQAANIFLIDDKSQSFQCIASKHQAYLEDFEKNDHASLLIKERRITNKKVTSVIYNYYLREDFIIGDW